MSKDHLPITLDGKLVGYVHTARAQGLVDSLRVLRANEDQRLPHKMFEVHNGLCVCVNVDICVRFVCWHFCLCAVYVEGCLRLGVHAS